MGSEEFSHFFRFFFFSFFFAFFVFLPFPSLFIVFLRFFRFSSFFAYSPGTRANDCNLLGKWGISLRPPSAPTPFGTSRILLYPLTLSHCAKGWFLKGWFRQMFPVPKFPPKCLSLQCYPGRRELWFLIFLDPKKNGTRAHWPKPPFYKTAFSFLSILPWESFFPAFSLDFGPSKSPEK